MEDQPPETSDHVQSFKDVLEKAKEDFLEKWEIPDTKTVALEDFELLKTLGKGGYGKVVLAKKKADSLFCAMKILDREKIVEFHQVKHAMSEINILKAIKFPFIVEMFHSFKDNSNVYIVLEFVIGGEMFTRIQKCGKLSENHSRFYAAQIILVVEYLHEIDIIYRDLKPENILIDLQGYLKVTDFGLAKRVKDRTWTLCGTPEYFAPEMILNTRYNKAVDWWAVGILIFEMTTGHPPFLAEEPMKVYEKIIAGRIYYPKHFSSDLKDLMFNILRSDRTKRLGNLKNGVEDIKTHPWFQTVKWMRIYEKAEKVPFIPKVEHPGSTEHFNCYEEEQLRIRSKEVCRSIFADF